jgi:hypothetical protein
LRSCELKMLKPMRLSTRIAILFAAVLMVYGGVEVVHWKLRPLGESPLIEFPAVPISQSEVEQFLDGDFQLITDMEALPEPVIKAFTETGGSRLTVANPGKRFQVSDVVWDESLPWKRLLFAGLSGNKCFMLYEQGGEAHFYVLALFTLTPPNLLKGVSEGSCVPAADIAELRSNVSSGLCSQPTPFYRVPHVTDH